MMTTMTYCCTSVQLPCCEQTLTLTGGAGVRRGGGGEKSGHRGGAGSFLRHGREGPRPSCSAGGGGGGGHCGRLAGQGGAGPAWPGPARPGPADSLLAQSARQPSCSVAVRLPLTKTETKMNKWAKSFEERPHRTGRPQIFPLRGGDSF